MRSEHRHETLVHHFFWLLAAIAPITGKSLATAADDQALPHRMDHPPNDPLTPQESHERMTAPPGFHVDLVASEPDIVNPVAMTIDERGRIWKEDQGQQRFVKLLDVQAAPQSVSWRALVNLVDPQGTAVLEEEDAITIHAPESADAYLIDFELLLRARGTDVKFGKFFVGGLSVRMPWDKANPRQSHLNSNGHRDRRCEQQRAEWCNVERPFGDEVYGIAIFDDPRNSPHPPGWRADEQGLVNPNVSSLSDWSIPAGKERVFRYQLLVYRQSATREQLQVRYRSFAAAKTAE